MERARGPRALLANASKLALVSVQAGAKQRSAVAASELEQEAVLALRAFNARGQGGTGAVGAVGEASADCTSWPTTAHSGDATPVTALSSGVGPVAGAIFTPPPHAPGAAPRALFPALPTEDTGAAGHDVPPLLSAPVFAPAPAPAPAPPTPALDELKAQLEAERVQHRAALHAAKQCAEAAEAHSRLWLRRWRKAQAELASLRVVRALARRCLCILADVAAAAQRHRPSGRRLARSVVTSYMAHATKQDFMHVLTTVAGRRKAWLREAAHAQGGLATVATEPLDLRAVAFAAGTEWRRETLAVGTHPLRRLQPAALEQLASAVPEGVMAPLEAMVSSDSYLLESEQLARSGTREDREQLQRRQCAKRAQVVFLLQLIYCCQQQGVPQHGNFLGHALAVVLHAHGVPDRMVDLLCALHIVSCRTTAHESLRLLQDLYTHDTEAEVAAAGGAVVGDCDNFAKGRGRSTRPAVDDKGVGMVGQVITRLLAPAQAVPPSLGDEVRALQQQTVHGVHEPAQPRVAHALMQAELHECGWLKREDTPGARRGAMGGRASLGALVSDLHSSSPSAAETIPGAEHLQLHQLQSLGDQNITQWAVRALATYKEVVRMSQSSFIGRARLQQVRFLDSHVGSSAREEDVRAAFESMLRLVADDVIMLSAADGQVARIIQAAAARQEQRALRIVCVPPGFHLVVDALSALLCHPLSFTQLFVPVLREMNVVLGERVDAALKMLQGTGALRSKTGREKALGYDPTLLLHVCDAIYVAYRSVLADCQCCRAQPSCAVHATRLAAVRHWQASAPGVLERACVRASPGCVRTCALGA